MAALLGVIVLFDSMLYQVPALLLGNPERLQFVPLPILPRGASSTALAFGLQVAANFAALCLISGRFARPGALFLGCLYGYVFLADRARYTNNMFLLALLLWIAAAEPIDPERPAPEWPSWVGRALVSAIYVIGFIMKLSPHWLSGEILSAAVFTYGRSVDANVFDGKLALPLQCLAIASAALEAFMSFGLWLPRWRRLAFALGAFFHLAIEAVLPVRVFSFAMIAAYTLFLPKEQLSWFLRARREHFVLWLSAGVALAFSIQLCFGWLLRNKVVSGPNQVALGLALGIFFGLLAVLRSWRRPSRGGEAFLPVALRQPLFLALLVLQAWGATKPAFGFTNRFGWKMFTEVTKLGGKIELQRAGTWTELRQSTWQSTLKPRWDSLGEQRDLMVGTARRALETDPSASGARAWLRYERNGTLSEELIEVRR